MSKGEQQQQRQQQQQHEAMESDPVVAFSELDEARAGVVVCCLKTEGSPESVRALRFCF